MHTILGSREHALELVKVGTSWNAILGTPCTSEMFVSVKAIRLLTSLEFSGTEPYPSTGEWQEHFAVEGCGAKRAHIAFFRARPAEVPQMTFYFVGESLASAQLLRDILPLVRLRATAELPKEADGKSCQRVAVADTKLRTSFHDVYQDNKPPIRGVWKEEWILQGCGAKVRLDVLLTPKPEGGTSITVGTIKGERQ